MILMPGTGTLGFCSTLVVCYVVKFIPGILYCAAVVDDRTRSKSRFHECPRNDWRVNFKIRPTSYKPSTLLLHILSKNVSHC